jgi:hypothetical protein
MGFFNSAEKAYFEQMSLSPLETMICRKYSFEKFPQFSQGNNVLDAEASNIDDFLWRDSCVSSIQLIGLFGTKQPIYTLKHISCRKFSFQKLTLFTQGNNLLDVPASNTVEFFLRDTCVSSP